jgi:glycosyltransferase involved in cell wall biosynthesis
MVKIAVLIITYNEEEYIKQCINQWGELPVLVLLSTKPWNGIPKESDNSLRLIKETNAKVVCQEWKTEYEQRNYGLAMLYDYDWVIISDSDEFYTEKDRKLLLETLENSQEKCHRANELVTYWKSSDFIFEPGDKHKPIIAVNPKKIKFFEHRQPQSVEEIKLQQEQPIIPVKIHHFSWVKPDNKIKGKIEAFSHYDIIKPGWYEDVWLKWNLEMNDIRPYGREISKAVFSPAPEEIKKLIQN